MPGGDEPGEREELVKRNTRQLYLMFFVFAIIIAAYSCRLLAWFDIGGNYPSYVRATLYLLLFVLWGYSLDQRIIQKPVLHCLRLMDVLMLIWLTLRTLKYEVVTDLTVVSLLPADSFYSAAWCIYCNFSGKIRRLSAFQKKLVVIADSDSIVSGCYHK